MEGPLVSICVPIYGVEKYIERCARSLFEQTYQNIEYVFVNDCTKDASIKILRKTLGDYPNRINQVRIINHKSNLGLGGARNTAVECATGEFLMWVDSDDYVDKKIVEKSVKKQIEEGADVVTTGAVLIKKDYTVYSSEKTYRSVEEYVAAVLTRKAAVRVWGRLIRRYLYINNHISVEIGINMGEDYQVTPLLYFFSQKISIISEPLYYYDCANEGAYSNRYSEEKNRQSWKSFDIVKEFFSERGLFNKELAESELAVIVAHLNISAREKLDYYYNNAVQRLDFIDPILWKRIPFANRVVLYLHNCRNLMNIYISIARVIRHMALQLKSMLR